MPRRQRNRKISQPPLMKGYRPFGMLKCKKEVVKLTFEEYESIRLVGYENLSQEQASEKMGVSRPTLTRVYNKAISNLSKALVEGKTLEIDGGNYELVEDWFRCRKCHKLIQGEDNHKKCARCNDFNSDELEKLNNEQ